MTKKPYITTNKQTKDSLDRTVKEGTLIVDCNLFEIVDKTRPRPQDRLYNVMMRNVTDLLIKKSAKIANGKEQCQYHVPVPLHATVCLQNGRFDCMM